MRVKHTLKKQFALVACLSAASQLASFCKLWLVAREFGIGFEMDGYNLALVIPTMTSGILSALIQTGIFPVRSAYQVEATSSLVMKFDRSLFWTCAIVGTVASLSIFLSAGSLMGQIVLKSTSFETHALIAKLLPMLAWLAFLNLSTDTMGYLLAMNDRFAYAAGAPILNGLSGALIIALLPGFGLNSLVASTVLGALVQLLVCVVGMKSVGFSFFGPLHPWMKFFSLCRKMVGLMLWILPGVIVSNFAASMPMLWASQFGEGAASAFGYAYRLHSSIAQLLIMTSSTLILAHFSKSVAQGDDSAIKRALVMGSSFSFGLGCVAIFCVLMLGQSLLENIFVGRFDADAAKRVSEMWAWLTVGLSFILLSNIFAKLWQAQGRTKLMSAMSSLGFLVLCLVFYVCRVELGEVSIAVALSVAPASIVVTGLFFLTSKKTLS